jgi:hypothetical protein
MGIEQVSLLGNSLPVSSSAMTELVVDVSQSASAFGKPDQAPGLREKPCVDLVQTYYENALVGDDHIFADQRRLHQFRELIPGFEPIALDG